MSGDVTILRRYLEPLERHLGADGVTEVVVNRPGEVGIESFEGWRWAEEPALTESWLRTLALAAAAFTQQDVGSETPICSTVLPGGERCQIVLPPAADGCASLTLRKPSAAASLDLEAFEAQGLFEETRIATGALTPLEEQLIALRDARRWREFFALAVPSRLNILISGATGSGKTTFARGLIGLIPEDERLITIEDARELTAPHRNRVHLLYSKDGQGLANVGPKQLLESALRMRPDRILLQELRDGTAFFYLRAVNSGHPGSITTLHADSADLAFEQLALLVKESEGGRDLGRAEIHALLRLLVDVVVQMRREGGRFRVVEVYYDPVRKRAPAA